MISYFESQKSQIFKNVEILIFVFDCETLNSNTQNNTQFNNNYDVFINCLNSIKQYSDNAHIFVLLHKMDLIHNDKQNFIKQQNDILHKIYNDIFNNNNKDNNNKQQSLNDLTIYSTSIWDETLYRAWSHIVTILIPNIQQINVNLSKLLYLFNNCNEIVLFERSTYLVISNVLHHNNQNHNNSNNNDNNNDNIYDSHRFEKISNIIKQFKLNLQKNNTNFVNLQILSQNYYIFLLPFTTQTNILLLFEINKINYNIQHNNHNSNDSTPIYSQVDENAIIMNINAAKHTFQNILSQG